MTATSAAPDRQGLALAPVASAPPTAGCASAGPSSARGKKPRSQSPASPPAGAVTAAVSLPFATILGGAAGVAGLGLGLGTLLLLRSRRRGKGRGGSGGKGASGGAGPCAKLKPSSKCVPLADGSACVIRREIAADNSCLFNSVGYAMHKSRTRAPHLRTVVAQQVSSDRTTYSDVFLGMTNEAYCHWIRQPYNWGGGIELSILAQAYGMEIAAWNIESCKEHVFGEESGYKRQAMVIYNGVHYDALAVSAGPRANPEDDETTYNPRTKRGKMITAAARKLVELAHKESQFHGAAAKKQQLKAAVTSTSASSTPSVAANKKAAAAPEAAAAAGTATAAAAEPPTMNGTRATASTAPVDAVAAANGPKNAASGDDTGATDSTNTTTCSGGSAAAATAAAQRKPTSGSATRRVARKAVAAAAVASKVSTTAELPAAEYSLEPAAAIGSSSKLSCGDCGEVLSGPAAARQHALSTGHQNYREIFAS